MKILTTLLALALIALGWWCRDLRQENTRLRYQIEDTRRDMATAAQSIADAQRTLNDIEPHGGPQDSRWRMYQLAESKLTAAKAYLEPDRSTAQ
jgi:hypothetical protein